MSTISPLPLSLITIQSVSALCCLFSLTLVFYYQYEIVGHILSTNITHEKYWLFLFTMVTYWLPFWPPIMGNFRRMVDYLHIIVGAYISLSNRSVPDWILPENDVELRGCITTYTASLLVFVCTGTIFTDINNIETQVKKIAHLQESE